MERRPHFADTVRNDLRDPVRICKENKHVHEVLEEKQHDEGHEQNGIKPKVDERPLLPQLVDASLKEALGVSGVRDHDDVAHFDDDEDDELEERDARKRCEELRQEGAEQQVHHANNRVQHRLPPNAQQGHAGRGSRRFREVELAEEAHDLHQAHEGGEEGVLCCLGVSAFPIDAESVTRYAQIDLVAKKQVSCNRFSVKIKKGDNQNNGLKRVHTSQFSLKILPSRSMTQCG